MFLLSLLVAIADRVGVLSPFRPALHDALSPGRLMLLALSTHSQSQSDAAAANNSTCSNAAKSESESHRRNEQLLRQLMIENARLRRDLRREKTAASLIQSIEPLSSLAQFQLVQANVVSVGGLPDSLRDLIIDAGKSAGITRSELVVTGQGPVVDAGTEHTVAAGDRVLTGAIVIGRIEKAARWVSMVQPVTAAGFKAQVMLLRQTPDGLHFGASGMLEGDESAECILTGIPHTEAVAVGDHVVSADVNGMRGPQLYFGHVTRADFLAGGQWDVRVQPAASLDDLTSVGILRLNLTDKRTAPTTSPKPAEEVPR
jgi:cell shape-determining protein MreC